MRSQRQAVCGVGLMVVAILCGCAPVARAGVIFEKKSEFGHIFVIDEDGHRRLTFEDGATQSEIDLKDPDELVLAYTRAIMSGLAAFPEPRRVLIVGLGGGTMPNYLRRAYPEMQMDIAELDPVVVEVAKKYFNFKEDERTKVYVGDGRKLIETTRNRYDIIFLDAYGADSIPYLLATKEFLQAVRARLTDNGIVVGNVWSSGSNKYYHSMIKTYLTLFPELHVIRAPASLNRIFIAPQQKKVVTREGMVKTAEGLKSPLMRKLKLGELIERGYDGEAEKLPREAKVLVDAEAPKE